MVQRLLLSGADVKVVDHNDNTALHISALWHNDDIYVLLVEHGADEYALNAQHKTPLEYLHGHFHHTTPVSRNLRNPPSHMQQHTSAGTYAYATIRDDVTAATTYAQELQQHISPSPSEDDEDDGAIIQEPYTNDSTVFDSLPPLTMSPEFMHILTSQFPIMHATTNPAPSHPHLLYARSPRPHRGTVIHHTSSSASPSASPSASNTSTTNIHKSSLAQWVEAEMQQIEATLDTAKILRRDRY